MAFEKGNKFSQGLTNSGAPPIFDSPEQLRDKAIEYFESLESELKITGEGVDEDIPVPKSITITGLCLWLGFESRQSFYDYEKKPEFSYIIKRLRMVVENQYEERLNQHSPTGAIFALKNMGWADKSEIIQTTSVIKVGYKKPTDE